MSNYTNFDLKKYLAEGKKAKDENIKETAPGFNHDCAAHVVHESYGYGICLDGEHTLVENAEGKHVVTHYDVFFKEGNKTVKNIPVEDLEVLTESHHGHKKKKNEADVAAEGETVEEAELTEGTDILDMIMQNPSLLGYLATYGAGLFAAVKGGLSAMDYCEANADNKLCKAWKDFSSDFSSVKNKLEKKEEGTKKEYKKLLNLQKKKHLKTKSKIS